MTVQTADTVPAPQSPAVQEALAQQALRAAELLILERAAVKAVTWPLRLQLVAIQRAAVKAWIGAFGSTKAPGDPIRTAAIVADLRGQLARVDTSSAAALGDWTARALDLGATQAIRATSATAAMATTGTATTAAAAAIPTAAASAAAASSTAATLTLDDVAPAVDDLTARITAGLEQSVRAQLDTAENALTQGAATGSFTDVDTALGQARRATSAAERDTVTAVQGAANAGRGAVADALGADSLILAEPDCCTTCAGLAGRTAPAGQPFDTKFASTYTDKPRLWPAGPLMQPPFHPNCRCERVVYLGMAPASAGPSLPEALQREAQRAVLKGWSLPSESNAERIRAARKALTRHPSAPKTVIASARRSVAAGKFPNRDVPHHAGRTAKTKT